MESILPRRMQEYMYDRAAYEYVRRLPPEHFMEAIPQARQREITLESLALVKARRPEVHVFNELLVQYPRPRRARLGQIVPDNMVVLSDQPIQATTSYNLPLEPAKPFWVMEYVSKNNPRKDYEKSFQIYERELKVPYCLIFYPDNQELTLYRLEDAKYVSVKPNEQGRYSISELDLELALVDGWVRFWHHEELLPLPAQLQEALDKAVRQAEQENQRAEQEKLRADEEARRANELQARAEANEQTIRALQEELARLRAASRNDKST
jgi:Uma2 family endonuclease